MKSTTAAIRYAKALFSLAKEEHTVSDVRKQLEVMHGVLAASGELREALLTPLHPAEERKAVLGEIAQRAEVASLLRNFLSYLIDQRRLVDFATICDEFARLADEDAGLLTAEVASASPLDERRKERLQRALSERTGRQVRLDVSVDPALIGGAVAKVGDLVFDGSIRTQLSQLRANLMKES